MIEKIYNEYQKLSKQSFQNITLHPNHDRNDIVWYNDLYLSPSIRYGHVEYFKAEGRVEVLHAVFYPSFFKPIPIFGFDIIALGGKVTGLFCDFTRAPFTIEALSRSLKDLNHKYKENIRTLPEWANFFSEDFVCINPNGLDEKQLIEDFTGIFRCFIGYSNWEDYTGKYNSMDDVKLSINTQNFYSLNQRKNDKTSKALSAYIGEEKAKEFIENVLFPVYRENTF
jgi:Ferredoxin-dependent bilin reductase